MQLNFNHPAPANLGRQMFQLRCIFVVCSILVMGMATVPVNGQVQFHRQRGNDSYRASSPSQPRNFGDTPSPTEMLARLKFHKQQETPLFDLLREAGSDIFSKLNDNEKKLAGRFVEDMILKEGMDSKRVSSLMEHMNIGPEARQALKEGIERAGGGGTAISPEDRKAIANNVRKKFLQKFGDQPGNSKSPSNQQALQRPNRPRDSFGPSSENESPNNRVASDAKTTADKLAQRQQLQNQIDAFKAEARKLRSNEPSHATAGNTESNPRSKDNIQLPQPSESVDRKVAGPGARTKPPNRGPATLPSDTDNASNNPGLNRSEERLPANPLALPGIDPNNKLAQEALRQFGLQSKETQQKILSEVQDKLRNGEFTPRQMEELFNGLQSAKSPDQFADRFEEASKTLGLPAVSREKIMESFGQLSGKGRSSNQGNQSDGTNAEVEQLGRDLLQDALQTYNDPDSGYELSGAFKRLKDHAEGIRSDRPMANFGSISKKLFEDSSKIFDSNSTSDARNARGVKPGQRLDQLLTEAASKAIANSADAKDKEGDSVFSSVLNGALGVALDQAVTLADDGDPDDNFNSDGGWNTHTNAPNNNDPLSSLRDFNKPQPNSTATSPSASNRGNAPALSGTSSSKQNSVQESVSAITDSILQTKFNWQTLLYAIGFVGLLSVAVFLLSRLLVTANPSVLKQAELQRKLQQSSTNPKDVVEAVDLFLLSRFGDSSSWWNAKHAADQISEAKPDWRDKVASLFQVYRWSRYQAAGKDQVSPEQNKLVVATLQQLIEAPAETFGAAKSPVTRTPSTDDNGEANS